MASAILELSILEPLGIDRPAYPATMGVPFPEGALPEISTTRAQAERDPASTTGAGDADLAGDETSAPPPEHAITITMPSRSGGSARSAITTPSTTRAFLVGEILQIHRRSQDAAAPCVTASAFRPPPISGRSIPWTYSIRST
jgi:hypothetical protein